MYNMSYFGMCKVYKMQNFRDKFGFDQDIFWANTKIGCHLKAYFMPFPDS